MTELGRKESEQTEVSFIDAINDIAYELIVNYPTLREEHTGQALGQLPNTCHKKFTHNWLERSW